MPEAAGKFLPHANNKTHKMLQAVGLLDKNRFQAT